jgi:hypothetical protein
MKSNICLRKNQTRKGGSLKAQLPPRPPVTNFETNFAEAVRTWAWRQTPGATPSGAKVLLNKHKLSTDERGSQQEHQPHENGSGGHHDVIKKTLRPARRLFRMVSDRTAGCAKKLKQTPSTRTLAWGSLL